jgi:membrane-bound lytic murein transglycosylase F
LIEGFEYELATQFAKDNGIKVEFIVKDSVEEVINSLQRGEGDLGAAGLTITDKRLNYLSFSPSYFEVNQTITCKKKRKIKSINDLEKLDIVTLKNTSYSENLENLKKKIKGLKWKELEGTNSELLLQQIWEDKNICTIVDAHILSLHRRYIPELKEVFKFKELDQIAWAINRKNSKLLTRMTEWFNKKKTRSLIADLKRKYFDFIQFDPYNLKTFISRIDSRLPTYRETFMDAAKRYNLPWELIAAVGYQESYWDPKAKSPTGVRGLMMLTRTTAKEVGVKNRLDPVESINGGAKYLRKLIDRMPDYLHIEDRIWFALASYNVGYYHLRDALALAILQNENPTRWHSVQKVLPLLSHKKYYQRLPFGHARGLEPVIYVKRIKDFYDILKKKGNRTAPIKVYK